MLLLDTGAITCLLKNVFIDERVEKRTPIIIGEIVMVSGINLFIEKFKD